ncbi:hypothetical protein MVEN_01752500 [Mycena venus]|uniref:Glycosyltransferase family 1 protein n=1 Tax=Mycena venus TaxID=2733690 RepID=A0A8H7CP85_9AGAR|nr:hypothetical protein MVEN_01752500 [Mycena venus]
MTAHHIVAMLPPAWGHTICYIQAAIQILKANPSVVITIVQHHLIVAQTEKELAGCAYDKARLRIVGVGEKGLVFKLSLFRVALEQLCAGWLETLAQLVQGSEAWPKPGAIHFDFLCGGFVVEPTKHIIGPDCKTLVWWSSALVSMPAHFTNQDFAAIAQEIYSDDSERKNRSLEEIVQEVVEASNGTDKLSGMVIKYPGGPDMYDHERHAYAAGPPKLGKAADGFIAVTSSCLEPVGIPYCRDLLKKRGQELFTIGMQAHELCWTNSSSPVALSDERAGSFLDNAVSQYGKKSVLYISFGSLFFPAATPHLLEALVNTLLDLEKPFPFVFALGSKMASLPPELLARVNASGKGLVCDFWVEQRAILQHGAIGWFLTHGGFNSVTESLTQGIPLIVWPVGGEQPVNAAFLSAGPNPVAIELFQIRAGAQIGPSLHSDAKITGTVEDASEEFKVTFAAARGARGAVLKANVAKLSSALREARAGEAAEELVRLAHF